MECLKGKNLLGKSTVFPLQIPIDFSGTAHKTYA